MNNKLDPETLKIPAYMRKKMIVSQAKQKLILTALDRKQAKLPHDSDVALAPVRQSRPVRNSAPRTTLSRAPLSQTPRELSGGAQMTLDMRESGKLFPAIGNVTHYLDRIGVAIIMLDAPLKQGELVLLESEEGLFIQEVEEIQIDRKPVARAKKGSHIGMKVQHAARVNGRVYIFS